jgi:hypothetical protein
LIFFRSSVEILPYEPCDGIVVRLRTAHRPGASSSQ